MGVTQGEMTFSQISQQLPPIHIIRKRQVLPWKVWPSRHWQCSAWGDSHQVQVTHNMQQDLRVCSHQVLPTRP